MNKASAAVVARPPASLVTGLNDEQVQAVTSPAQPLCILAGAGTGKTRVLTRRIAYRAETGAADPRRVLALTFSRKAANELFIRLRRLGLRDRPMAGTFHAVAYGQLRTYWAERQQGAPTLLEHKGRLLSSLLPAAARRSGVLPAEVAGEIEWAKARLIPPEHYVASTAGRRAGLAPEAMADVYQRYEAAKHRQRLVDFDDLLWLCARAIESDTEFAAAQRWRFRHLFVDEFQDVNPLQHRLLRAWLGPQGDLCVVGDPNQAIYGWNGADAGFLVDFASHFPGGDTVALTVNYRSSPPILAVANRLLASGGVGGLRLRATREHHQLPVVTRHETDIDEAASIARAARARHGPQVPWSHQAVLVRTHAQAVPIAEAFQAARIPCRVQGQAAFRDLPEVRDGLRFLARTRVPFQEALAALEASVEPAAEDGEPPDSGAGAPDAGDATAGASAALLARQANVGQLIRLATEYANSNPRCSADGFSSWLATVVGGEGLHRKGDAVEITTFHAAKGLEWPVVHLAGLEAGLVPINHATTPDTQAEERRLLYVAITRAERELSLSWAAHRTFGTKTVRRRRSPYLDDLQPLLDALAAGDSAADAGNRLPAVRQALASALPTPARDARVDARSAPVPTATPGGAPTGSRGRVTTRVGAGATPGPGPGGRHPEAGDTPVLEALERWRGDRARASGVPAAAVLSDQALAGLAGERPSTQQEVGLVEGIGPIRADRFGSEILGVLARFPAPSGP